MPAGCAAPLPERLLLAPQPEKDVADGGGADDDVDGDDDDDDDGVDDDGDDDEEQMMGNWRGGAKGLLRGAQEESVDGTISISFW